ncbi:MAG TPA: hypothetical protein VJ044_04090 [Candidatus Hodarchaeales archaeon]|nr:hypothetical protein [Candidatus Hodarchaeales archaeon]
MAKSNEQLILNLASYGFHAKTIAAQTFCSDYHAYKVCRQNNVRIRDYRDGLNKNAKRIIASVKAEFKIYKKTA